MKKVDRTPLLAEGLGPARQNQGFAVLIKNQEKSKGGEEAMTNQGGYRPGAGRPVGVPNRVTNEFREALRDLDQPAVGRLQTLLKSEDEGIAMRAVELTLSYIHGKPRSEMKIEATSAPKSLSPQELDDLPANVLRKMLSGQRIKPEDFEGLPPEVLRRIAGIEEQEHERDDEKE